MGNDRERYIYMEREREEIYQCFIKAFFVTLSRSLSLWNITKRKPTKVISHAHGSESHWIISIASYPYSDLFASGNKRRNRKFDF